MGNADGAVAPSKAQLRDAMMRNGDPLIANLLICLSFFLIGLIGLGEPHVLYFDEQWYIPASTKMLNSMEIINREHPMLAKELIAGFYWVFGGSWVSARIGSLIFGTIGLFGFQRAHFILTRSATSTIIFGALVAGNCLYMTTSRMAVLDPYMLGFSGLGLAFFARGMRESRKRLLNFVNAGFCMGAAMACKWTVAPLCLVMAVATLVRFRSDVRTLLTVSAAAFVPAASIYIISFMPLMFADPYPLAVSDFILFHRAMAFHLSTFIADHPYQSHWWQWPIGMGQMWLLDPVWYDTDRIIVLAQNPVAALLVLPSVIAGAVFAIFKKDAAIAIPVAGYLLMVLFWSIGHKPNIFIYHYNLPFIFSLSVVAQFLAAISKKVTVVTKIIIFLYLLAFSFFYPLATGGSQGWITNATREVYGWSERPGAHQVRRPLGNGRELSKWAVQCVNVPSDPECSNLRRNVVESD